MEILLNNLKERYKRDMARNQRKKDLSEKMQGFPVNGFFVIKESEIPKDKIADYAKNLKEPSIKNILYFQENKISAYRIGAEIKLTNLEDVLPDCK